MQTDFLVIGSGIAGLTYALKVAEACPDKTITILTKTQSDETNTKYAQGGIAGVMDPEQDSFEKHIEDTLVAGDGLCNRRVVEIVVKEGVQRIEEIISWGAQFDKESDGDYKLGKEGGHSEYRILHHKDVTGREMERALLAAIAKRPNIQLISHCFVIDIITQHHLGYLVTKSTPDIECYGVYVLNLVSNKIEKILAKITLLATGGNGQVYRSTTNPAIATGDGVAMVYRAKGRIEFDDVTFHYPAASDTSVASLEGNFAPQTDELATVLHGVTATIEPGQMVALVGPSGAGKSTMSSLVTRLYDVSSGAIRVDGTDVRDISLASLRSSIGIVAQDPHMFHTTVGENLRYARPDATDSELRDACKAAQVLDVIERLPDGFDTVVGERGYRLSGGEKQRLAIARMLVKDPAIVILDEATSHLDSENEHLVQMALATALADRTSIVIAHRLSTITAADQILVMDSGRIVQRGTHATLVTAGGLYTDLYRTLTGPTA